MWADRHRAESAAQALGGITARVDLESIAAHLQVDLHYRSLEPGTSGILICTAETRSLVVNQNHSHTRQRFSLAHSLGHACLHHTPGQEQVFMDQIIRRPRDDRASKGSYFEEVEANTFAAALLVPLATLHVEFHDSPVMNPFDLDESYLRSLSKRLGVSQQVLSFRLLSVGLLAW